MSLRSVLATVICRFVRKGFPLSGEQGKKKNLWQDLKRCGGPRGQKDFPSFCLMWEAQAVTRLLSQTGSTNAQFCTESNFCQINPLVSHHRGRLFFATKTKKNVKKCGNIPSLVTAYLLSKSQLCMHCEERNKWNLHKKRKMFPPTNVRHKRPINLLNIITKPFEVSRSCVFSHVCCHSCRGFIMTSAASTLSICSLSVFL